LAFEGEKSDQSSGSAASGNRNTNNYLAQYEAAQRKNMSFDDNYK